MGLFQNQVTMRNTALTLLFTLAVALAAPAQMGQMNSSAPPLKLKVGDTAPDFTVKYFDGTKLKDLSLHDFRGKKNVVVAFFVFAINGG